MTENYQEHAVSNMSVRRINRVRALKQLFRAGSQEHIRRWEAYLDRFAQALANMGPRDLSSDVKSTLDSLRTSG